MALPATPGGGPGMAPNEGATDGQSIGIPGLSRPSGITVQPAAQRPAPTGVIKSPNSFMDATANPSGPQVKAPESSPTIAGSDVQNAIGAGGGDVGGELGLKPSKAVPAQPAKPGTLPGGGGIAGPNKSPDSGGFPAAASGPGTGRQPAQSGATIGQTLAKPRTPVRF